MANDQTSGKKRKKKTLSQSIWKFFCSYKLAVFLMFLLLVLTYLGTIVQPEIGLYEAKKKYFQSFWLMHNDRITPYNSELKVPIPLPGGYLVMVLLFINMSCGALVHARKNLKFPGMIIAHSSILFMLLSGFVTYHFGKEGNMRLFENQSSSEYQSYHNWSIEISKPGGVPNQDRILIIPKKQLAGLTPKKTRTFHSKDLPFELTVFEFHKNCLPQSVSVAKGEPTSVDGFFLEPQDPAERHEQNIAGCFVSVKKGDFESTGILWGFNEQPWTVTLDNGEKYLIDLRRRTWNVPFKVTLDDFNRELHPGTGMAKSFDSWVTRTADDGDKKIHIEMNEPMRAGSYTFYQESWGPPNAKEGEKLFSVFAVWWLPAYADLWPAIALTAAGIGMAIHFVQKLFMYLMRSKRSEARKSAKHKQATA